MFFYKGESWSQTPQEERQREVTHREDNHLQAEERDLELIISSQPSEETNPPNNLIVDFLSPEL